MSKSPYNYRWQKARLTYLARHPLCSYCNKQGIVKAAEVVDHIIPHRGDQELFWSVDNWQSLCKACHDGLKQQEETRGYGVAFGIDGWPLDNKHPVMTGGIIKSTNKSTT